MNISLFSVPPTLSTPTILSSLLHSHLLALLCLVCARPMQGLRFQPVCKPANQPGTVLVEANSRIPGVPGIETKAFIGHGTASSMSFTDGSSPCPPDSKRATWCRLRGCCTLSGFVTGFVSQLSCEGRASKPTQPLSHREAFLLSGKETTLPSGPGGTYVFQGCSLYRHTSRQLLKNQNIYSI